jgi:hypothetical protein
VIVSIAAGAPAYAQAPTTGGTPGGERAPLSDETTVTRWADAVARAKAYAEPTVTAPTVGRLRMLTEDGFPEVYVLLARQQAPDGSAWIQIRLPQRPNNVTGWVRRRALGPFHLVRTRLVVNRAALDVTLYDRGVVRFRARVGIGAPGTPTPAGSFWIREKFHVRHNPLYGTRAMGTAAYSSSLTDWPGGGVIGLHGTGRPGLIPGRPSHGCIRLRNRDMERLYSLTPVGTPLLIE